MPSGSLTLLQNAPLLAIPLGQRTGNVSLLGGGGAPVPSIANVSPSVGATLAPGDSWSFDVAAPLGLLLVIVSVVLDGLAGNEELIWNGTAFVLGYENSTRTAITNGFRYAVKRTAGWPPAEVHFKVQAIDKSGQVTS